jgi:hypothetical protein
LKYEYHNSGSISTGLPECYFHAQFTPNQSENATGRKLTQVRRNKCPEKCTEYEKM